MEKKLKINTINIQCNGYVICRSGFYTAHDMLSGNLKYTFQSGINTMIGEIDSGNWAISYLLSMYKHRRKDFVLSEPCKIVVNNERILLNQLSELACYMDRLYPLFAARTSVKKLIVKGLKYSKLEHSYEDIRKMFELDSQRVERPLTGVGNEIFRAMAAIGFSYGKEIFCFPWLSHMRFEYYHENLNGLLKILEGLNKIVIIPVGALPLKI